MKQQTTRKLCTFCKEKESILFVKSVVNGKESYLCWDCITRLGDAHRNKKNREKQKEKQKENQKKKPEKKLEKKQDKKQKKPWWMEK